MIVKSDIAALWTVACPSFDELIRESCSDDVDGILYVHAGSFARHLLELHRSRDCQEFPAIADFIERLYTEGDDYTREFATIGILEGIQNVWGHTDSSPELFLPFLRPASRAAWQSLNEFWAGRSPGVCRPLHHQPT